MRKSAKEFLGEIREAIESDPFTSRLPDAGGKSSHIVSDGPLRPDTLENIYEVLNAAEKSLSFEIVKRT